MVPFSVALIFDLTAAVVLIVSVARLFRGHGSPTLLSYLFYLVFWYALVLYMNIFLFASRFLPENAQHGYIAFNSILVVPLNGLVAFFFADFMWRWLEKPMPRLLRLGLPILFLVILFTYAREMLGRLSTEPQPQTFVISAPASLSLMFACLLFVSLYAAIAGHGLNDRDKGRHMLLFAAVTGSGLIVGLPFVFGQISFIKPDWQNATSVMILATANIGGWIFASGFFRRQARTTAVELARADLSGLEARYGVSPRECEIISLILMGKSNREITEVLYISQETVKKHIYNAYRKIGVKNRMQLVRAVMESSASLPSESN